MNEFDLYEGFAERYDLIQDRLDDNDSQMTAFFLQLFSDNDVHSILDSACGTGRHLLLFSRMGYEVWGSDVSNAMLTQANNNLTHYSIDLDLLQADFRDLPLKFQRHFDAVVCLGSIGYMPDEFQFLRAFQSMFSVLRDRGILVLTTITTDKQWNEKPKFKLAVNTPEVTRLFVMDYFEESVQYHILDIFHSIGVNNLKVWSAELRVLLRDTQERLLKTAGFKEVNFYGDFNFSPYIRELSDLLITVAYK